MMNGKHIATACVILIAVVAIGTGAFLNSNMDRNSPSVPSEPDVPDTPDVPITPSEGDILVAYFSKTGTTEARAQRIADITGGDLVEIEPTTPYPTDYTSTTTIAREELNSDARPAINTEVDDVDRYETIIIIGFPIWYGAPPMAILTFLEDYDLSGKTIVTFCTSGSSPISGSTSYIEGSAPGAEVIQGQRLTSDTDVESWLSGLGLTGS